MNMREKRSVKKTTINNSSSSIVTEGSSVVNGVYNIENSANSVFEARSVNNKFSERWNAMDYEKYFMYRKNGSVCENNLMPSSTRVTPSFENISSPSSDSSPQDDVSNFSPGNVIKFYKQCYGEDYWNVFPKTDYTYSPSSPFYKKEVVPGIPVVPNLSRRPCHRIFNNESSSLNSPKTSKKTEHESDNKWNSSNEHPVIFRRNARFYREKYWSSRNSWIRRTYETIKTVIITSITTSVTTTTETVMHPMKKPYISFPLLSILFALLLCILFYSKTDVENGVTSTFQWMPIEWLEWPIKNIKILTALAEPFIWTYKVASSCLYSLFTCLCMVPTLLSQLVQSISTFLMLFQRIPKWSFDSPAISVINREKDHINSVEKSSVNFDEIRRIVLDVLSEREHKVSEDINEMKKPANEEIIAKSMNDFIMRVNEKLSSLENLYNDQKKVLDEIHPHLKSEGDKLTVTKFNSEQSAVLVNSQDISNISSVVGWSEVNDKVVHIVKSMLKQYHADRTGMPDYALMSNGGTIIGTGCTQTYTRGSGNIYILGFPLWNVNSNPDVIIKPGIMPGECWAFEGSEGYVAIGLALPVYVNGFTMEHTPKELTPYGNINSAPHQFSVWGLRDTENGKPQFMGRFKFLDNGESLQYFEAEKLDDPVQVIELRIESNHGSKNYTCLYRFRVHGTPA